MLNGEPQIGCTLHYVTDGTIDTGAILGTHRMPVNRERSLLWNIASLYSAGTAMIAKALAAFTKGKAIETIAQSGGRYFSYPETHDVATFLARGHRLYSNGDYAAILQWYGVNASSAQALVSKAFPT